MKTFGGLSRQDLRKWLVGHALPPADMMVVAQELFEELERAERERDANKEDAERYRWLEAHICYMEMGNRQVAWLEYDFGPPSLCPGELVEAIDAAREGK